MLILKGKNISPAALTALEKGDLDNFIAASTPGGIEAQEKEGQTDLCENDLLPLQMSGECTKDKLESMGIIFGSQSDDLFIHVTLPQGWKKEATDHSMWSKLLDDKGRKRASIFYKAAFYDKKAHISLSNRFSCAVIPEDNYESDISYEDRKYGNWYGIVYDLEEIIFRTDPIKSSDYHTYEKLINEARDWLEKNYPDWRNPLAYWD